MLNHPNISTIYEIGEADGEYFIAMELIEGEPLDRYLSRHRPGFEQLLDIGIQIADALDAAHAKGVIHRDIKPANILINPRGQAKIRRALPLRSSGSRLRNEVRRKWKPNTWVLHARRMQGLILS